MVAIETEEIRNKETETSDNFISINDMKAIVSFQRGGPAEAYLNFTVNEAIDFEKSDFEIALKHDKTVIVWCVVLIKDQQILHSKTSKSDAFKFDLKKVNMVPGIYTLLVLPIHDKPMKEVVVSFQGIECSNLTAVKNDEGMISLSNALMGKAAGNTGKRTKVSEAYPEYKESYQVSDLGSDDFYYGFLFTKNADAVQLEVNFELSNLKGFEIAYPGRNKVFQIPLAPGNSHIIILRQTIKGGNLSIAPQKYHVSPPPKDD